MVRRFVVVLAGVLGVVCAVLALGGPAEALETHVFSLGFGSPGAGAGQVALAVNSGVAVSSATHDVYVADTGNARVDEFEANGTFVRAWGWGVADGLPSFESCSLVCQAGVAGSGPGQFASPVFVAVDNSAGGSAGDVYVGDSADGVITKFSGSGALVESWGATGQISGSPTGEGGALVPFGELSGIAVDSSGKLDVLENSSHVLFEFSQEGVFTTGIETPRRSEQYGLAVDSAGDFFKLNAGASVEEITGSGGGVGQVSPLGATGVAVDSATGDLYIAEPGAVKHYVFTELGVVSEPGGSTCTIAVITPCPATGSFGAGAFSGGSGIAVDSSDSEVFVADAATGRIDGFVPAVIPDVRTSPASEVLSTSATLNGTVNPDGLEVTDCHFDYVAAAEYNPAAANPYGAGQTAACEEIVGSGSGEVSVHAIVHGLRVGMTYHFRLQAENANHTASYGVDETLSTPPPPSISGAVATNLTASSVDLGARVNPEGVETTYHFEWGASASYGTSVPVPDGHIAVGTSDVPVGVHLSGLAADTTYHWRVVASSASGTTTGVDHVFVYDTAASGGLPDNRAYEMVTPPQKNGALIGDLPFGPLPSIAEDGSRVILGTIQCFAGAGSCSAAGAVIGSPYEFSRTAGGWVASSLAPPAAQFESNVWYRYSADTGMALFAMPTAPERESNEFYVRQLDGSFVDVGPGPQNGRTASLTSVAATADFSHMVVSTQATVGPVEKELFEYTGTGDSVPSLVGVSGGLGSTDLISACSTYMDHTRTLGEVSADGRTVYFTAEGCGSGTGVNAGTPVPVNELFARVDNNETGAHTVAISQPSAIQPAPPNNECITPACVENTTNTAQFRAALFTGASSDGSKAFFTSEQQLTDNASEGSDNLYLYDFASPVGERLVDVSAGDTSGGGPGVGGVMALSGDGSHVYFVASGVLTGAANGEGQVARAGVANLYVFERDAAYPRGRVAFIAVLPEADNPEWNVLGEPANVTPDGRFLVFTSSGALTPDTTRTDGAQQVFSYDAQTGGLVRISIGEHGFNDNGNGGAGSAMIAPAAVGFRETTVPARTDPTMSHDGAFVFFMSPVALTPGALDSVQIAATERGPQYAENLYEYHEGQVYLISDGRDTSTAPGAAICEGSLSAVCLLGVDGTGTNVFFTTVDPLVPRDTDTQLDVYDARVCTASEPCIPASAPVPAGCVGEGCHGVPAGAPSLPGAGSAVFSGAGDLAPPVSRPVVRARSLSRAQKLARALRVCRSRRGRRRAGCEALARKRYGSRSRARSTSHRGGK